MRKKKAPFLEEYRERVLQTSLKVTTPLMLQPCLRRSLSEVEGQQQQQQAAKTCFKALFTFELNKYTYLNAKTEWWFQILGDNLFATYLCRPFEL